ncbi:hypothetical protein V1511DRAFT_497782 [Dipodascopsis uninucleata]
MIPLTSLYRSLRITGFPRLKTSFRPGTGMVANFSIYKSTTPRTRNLAPLLLVCSGLFIASSCFKTTILADTGSGEIEVPELKASEIEEVLQEAVDDANSTVSESTEAATENQEEYGAFNPVTGEINWDCPCLGGMAHGPCGPEFKAAFSCFVFSEAEPKGVNCISLFETMQNCFRKHPEVYADDIKYIDEQQHEAEIEEAALSTVSTVNKEKTTST